MAGRVDSCGQGVLESVEQNRSRSARAGGKTGHQKPEPWWHRDDETGRWPDQKNWAIVKDWSVNSRYDPSISQARAEELSKAIRAKTSGVYKWVTSSW